MTMKLMTPEIVWHSKEPVFSADFHRNGSNWRLATGGADNDIKIWKVLVDGESGKVAKIEYVASLSRHTKAVNVVRFSPCGEYLASSGDDSVVCVWRLEGCGLEKGERNLIEGEPGKENWTVAKMMRGHLEDVYDLCWSPDSAHLISGSVDNTAIVWDVQKGQLLHTLKESHQYVQGVAWDPMGRYIAALSCDRNLRIYSTDNLKFKCVHTVSKITTTDQSGGSKQVRMWLDESLNSFFRRLCFTPDGSLLIVPSGRSEVGEKSKNSTYIFARNDLTKPVLQLPGPEKPTVCVRCCPVLFELLPQTNGAVPLTNLPYRMVFAVAGLDSVLLYDTQHTVPFAFVSNIHYAGITDMTWSNNGRLLFITSFDCYCSVIMFSEGELGTPLPDSQLPPHLLSQSEKKQPSPKLKLKEDTVKGGQLEKKVSEVELKGTPSPSKVETASDPRQSSGKTPRRIRPTQLSSFPSPGASITSPSTPPTTINAKTPPPASSTVPPTTLDTKPPPPASSNAPPTNETVPKTVGNSGGSRSEAPRRVNFITLTKFNTDKEQGQSSSSNNSSSQSSLDEDSKATGEPMEVHATE